MRNFEARVHGDTNFVQGRSSSRLYSYRAFGKRLFDITMVLASLPVVAPLIFILWVIVRLDGGAGFYSQTRIGKNGREFRCWKLRTMIPNADRVLKEMCDADPELAREWHENQKLENDPRITRIGRFLRASSLDELPQLWNILLGDMSIVGPRPFMADQAPLYNTAGGKAYYTVRPGITGPWQVFGRGETTFVDRVKYDTMYCRDLSMVNDIVLIWKTFGVVLRGTGS